MTLWTLLVAQAHIRAAYRWQWQVALARNPWIDSEPYHRRALSWQDYRRLYGHRLEERT